MIKGFSKPKRMPRLGKIYLGIKAENDQGKTYPSAVDYFVVRADGVNTSQAAADAFHAVYGAEPREITIAFPSDDPELFMPQYLTAYRGGGGRSELWCKGNGEWARRADGQGGYAEIPCLYQDCPIFQQKKCKPLTRLLFLLPDVEGIGVWELDTTSYYSAQNLGASVQLIRQLTRGRIAMIPLKLRVVPQTVSPDGTLKTVYVLDLKLENVKLMDLLNRIPRLELSEPVGLVEPAPDDMPDDLYVESSLVNDQDILRASNAPPTRPPVSPAGSLGHGGARQGDQGNGTSQRRESNRQSPAPQQQTQNEDLRAAFRGVRVVNYEGHPLAKVTLKVLRTGEEIAAVTDNPAFIKQIKQLSEGEIVLFDVGPSDRWQQYLELTRFELDTASSNVTNQREGIPC
ncbi:MAG: hypothetical protein K6T83_12205 [Alicyclobacillus sp.]|nr:hypothetical protein [Alicyclobacillus sp.]